MLWIMEHERIYRAVELGLFFASLNLLNIHLWGLWLYIGLAPSALILDLFLFLASKNPEEIPNM
jgi:hypothetical protein